AAATSSCTATSTGGGSRTARTRHERPDAGRAGRAGRRRLPGRLGRRRRRRGRAARHPAPVVRPVPAPAGRRAAPPPRHPPAQLRGVAAVSFIVTPGVYELPADVYH